MRFRRRTLQPFFCVISVAHAEGGVDHLGAGHDAVHDAEAFRPHGALAFASGGSIAR